MDDTPHTAVAGTGAATATATDAGTDDSQRGEELLDDELLVEEISIDGMCGVY